MAILLLRDSLIICSLFVISVDNKVLLFYAEVFKLITRFLRASDGRGLMRGDDQRAVRRLRDERKSSVNGTGGVDENKLILAYRMYSDYSVYDRETNQYVVKQYDSKAYDNDIEVYHTILFVKLYHLS